MATTFGTRPEDTVADSRGNVLSGVALTLYATKADATAQTAPVSTVTTNSRGLWSYSDSSARSGLWARDAAGNIWAVNAEEVGASIDAKTDKTGTPRSLADYGVLPGNTAAQNRTAFTAAAASGYTDFVLPAGTYQWSAATQGDWMMTFTGANRIRVRGLNAVINDTTTYTNQGTFTGLFLLDNCKDFEVTGVEYVGPVLGSPSTLLGYQGAMVVRAINGTDGVKVDMRMTNARYGVQTGEYGDATKGLCKNFDVKIRGSMVGYPLAAYYADGIRHDIDMDGVHRVVYIAGCNDVRGAARFRDQYIADTAYLITDTLTSGTDAVAQVAPPANPTTSRGCTNVDVSVYEKGSTQMTVSSAVAGISLSRVDPCTFSNIKVNVYTTSTDTISRYFGGFKVASAANVIWSRYAFNWEPTVLLQNITISGVVDHSAQTVSGNTAGDFYMVTYDTSGSHAATVQNFCIDGMTIHKSSGGTRACWFHAPGLADIARFNGIIAPIQDWDIFTNGTSTVRFQGSKLGPIGAGGSLVALADSTSTSIGASTNVTVSAGSTVSAAGLTFKQKQTSLTLSGASTSWTAAIPVGALVMGVQGYVTTSPTGATGYQVGVSGDVSRYVNTNTLTVGSTFGPANQAATEVSPRYYTTATDLVVTAKTSNFTGGVLHLYLTYAQFSAPTS